MGPPRYAADMPLAGVGRWPCESGAGLSAGCCRPSFVTSVALDGDILQPAPNSGLAGGRRQVGVIDQVQLAG